MDDLADLRYLHGLDRALGNVGRGNGPIFLLSVKSDANLIRCLIYQDDFALLACPFFLSARAILGHITPRERGAAAEEN